MKRGPPISIGSTHEARAAAVIAARSPRVGRIERQIPHRMENCEYAAERNKYARDGLWKIGGTRQVVYAKKSLSAAERLTAIRRLTGD